MPLYESVADQEDLKASSFLVFATNLPKSSLEVKGHIPCSGNFEGENFCGLLVGVAAKRRYKFTKVSLSKVSHYTLP